jgi:D-lactate dehydrogenase
MVPTAVAWPRNENDIVLLLEHARNNKTSLTFRTGGTSLSGQAVTNGILVDLSRHWRSAEVLKNGESVKVKPGIVGAHVNEYLAPHGRKIGPDPASISAAMMGGILANNSSGMCCGTEQNAYQTLESMTIILASGTRIESHVDGANEILCEKEPALYNGLLNIRQQVLNNTPLSDRIRKKYRYKNTTGYGLNALIDFERPIDILTHLMIGSEGTLGFISEAVLKTVPVNPFASTGLLFFENVVEACRATKLLCNSGAAAIELMDRAALRSVENQKGAPNILRQLPPSATALLVEYQAQNFEALSEFLRAEMETERQFRIIEKLAFTNDPEIQQSLWKIRKGTFPAVGAARKPGTAVLIEDVLFPQETLAAGVEGLQSLFAQHGYHDANIFGHAKDGNLHFVLSQAFDSRSEINRYDKFMRDVVKLVVKDHEGALKAEHGTGRNMAPFVADEWGNNGFEIMKELKKLLDPMNILSPGVVIPESDTSHLNHLKDLPSIDPLVDKCIECGYCEPICPSEKLTLSPRRRIIVAREMQRQNELGNTSAVAELATAYKYQGIDTCAADGLCATTCPVAINTGAYIKTLREKSHTSTHTLLANHALNTFASVEARVRIVLRAAHAVAHVVSHRFLRWLSFLPHKVLQMHTPTWSRFIPLPTQKRENDLFDSKNETQNFAAVLFPTCVTRNMGAIPQKGTRDRTNTLAELAQKAAVPIYMPLKPEGMCCGMPFFSKGFTSQGTIALTKLVDELWIWTQSGSLPVVVDNSPCTLTMLEQSQYLPEIQKNKLHKMRVIDIVEFTHDFLLPKLNLKKIEESAYVYPVCSITKMNLTHKLRSIAERCATKVVMPLRPACCAQAGDRGFSFPELIESATKKIEWENISAGDCKCEQPQGRYASSRTCEISLSENSAAAYDSILELVRKAAG